MAFMKIRKNDGTLLDLLFFKGDKGDKGESAKFSYGDTLPDTMEDGEVFFKTDGADYIVEQGTSGIWTYRKWNSGIAECWGRSAESTSEGYITVTLPFDFSDNLYVVSATPIYPINTQPTFDVSIGIGDMPVFYVYVRKNASTEAYAGGTVMLHVVGRWK